MRALKVCMMPFVTGIMLSAASAAAAQRPNFVLIIADDMGMEALPYGHPMIQTPNLKRLADGGMRFDRAFVTTSSCSPSRASIITGRYPHSTGAERLHQHLPAEQLTFVELLRNAGYWTASAGKWHLGPNVEDRFDLVKTLSHLRAAARAAGSPHVSGTEDWVDVLRERPQDQPFFLWFASFDPHREYFPGGIEEPHRPAAVVVPPYLTLCCIDPVSNQCASAGSSQASYCTYWCSWIRSVATCDNNADKDQSETYRQSNQGAIQAAEFPPILGAKAVDTKAAILRPTESWYPVL